MEPLLSSVVAALTGKLAAAAADGSRAAVAKLVDLVREKVSGDDRAQRALEAAEQDPADETAAERLRKNLDGLCDDDPDFKRRLEAAWGDVEPHVAHVTGDVHNVNKGIVEGSLFQVGHVHGNSHFNEPPSR